MSRILLQIILPLLAPFAVYVLWLWYAGKRAEISGDEPPAFTRGAAFWAIIVGFVLMVISLAFLATVGGVAPDSGRYQAPRLEDGKITKPMYLPEDNQTGDQQP